MKIKCARCTTSVVASDLAYDEAHSKINVCFNCAAEIKAELKNEMIVNLIMKGYQSIDAKAKIEDLNLDKQVVKAITASLAKSSEYAENEIGEGEVRAITAKFPNSVFAKGKSVSSVEIDVDYLSKVGKYQSGGWEDLIKKITARWVVENSFTGKGTIWDWGTPSVNFNHQSYSMFYAVLGMPEKFRKYLGTELEGVLGKKYVRSNSDYVSPNSREGWRAVCQIEDCKTWGIGAATRRFVENFKGRKLPWHKAGVPSSGNGAAMRAAPVGIWFRNDYRMLKLAAGMQAMVSHNDPMAIASSIVTAYAVARLLRMNPGDLTDVEGRIRFCGDLGASIGAMETGRTRNGDAPSSLARRIGVDIPRFLRAGATPREVQKVFWSGAYVLESLPFALYCFLHSPDDFDRVLFDSVNESRDSDTVAAMACTFSGALNGLERSVARRVRPQTGAACDLDGSTSRTMDPEKSYLADLEWRDELLQLADNLSEDCWRVDCV